MVSFSGGSSKGSSNPQDLTPEAFKNLQNPLAQALYSFIQTGGPSPITGTQPMYTATGPTAPAAVASQPANPLRTGPFARSTGTPATTVTPASTLNINPAASGLGDTSQLVAPVTGQQQSVIDQIVSGYLNNGNNAAANQAVQDTLGGKYLTPESNPFLKAFIETAQRPLQEQFENSIIPQLLSRFANAGQEVQGAGSSAFAREANLAASQQGRALGDVATSISYQNYGDERNRQMQAISQASDLSSAQIQQGIDALQAASLPQLTKDLGIQRGLEAFNKRIDSLLQALSIAGGVTQPTIANATKQKSSQFGGGIMSS